MLIVKLNFFISSGGVDYDLKLWDFAGMDPSLRSFRKIRPAECHVLNHLGNELGPLNRLLGP